MKLWRIPSLLVCGTMLCFSGAYADNALANGTGEAVDPVEAEVEYFYDIDKVVEGDDTEQATQKIVDDPVVGVDENDVSFDDDIALLANANGWGYHGGDNVYYYVDGQPLKGSQRIDGKWYRFDLEDGHLLTGHQKIGDEWFYYHPEDGHLLFGNLYINEKWYRFDPVDGHRLSGSQYIDGNWYRYDLDEGYLLFGRQYIDGNWYRYDELDGHLLLGSQYIDGKWYRYHPVEGHMLIGNQYIDGNWYRYDLNDGYLLFGNQYIDGNWYRYDPVDGHLLFGSQFIDGQWFRYDINTAELLFGWQFIDSQWFFYDLSDAHLHFGQLSMDNKWYWLDEDDGHRYHGFVNIDGQWFYYHPRDGYLMFGRQTIGGRTYIFHDVDGHLVSGITSDLKGPHVVTPKEGLVYPYTLNEAILAQTKSNSALSYDAVKKYMDPNNFSPETSDAYQFLILNNGYTGITAEQIDAFIEKNCAAAELRNGRKSTMRGIGASIVQASKATGVNEVYILAHAIHESDWGCSRLATGAVSGYEGYFNFYGIGAFDRDPLNGGAYLAKDRGWDTPAKAIIGGAEYINRWYITASYDIGNGVKTTQNTLYKMRFAPGIANTWHQYATDLGWSKKIAQFMGMAYSQYGFKPDGFEWPIYAS